jgi:hypothetical protein
MTTPGQWVRHRIRDPFQRNNPVTGPRRVGALSTLLMSLGVLELGGRGGGATQGRPSWGISSDQTMKPVRCRTALRRFPRSERASRTPLVSRTIGPADTAPARNKAGVFPRHLTGHPAGTCAQRQGRVTSLSAISPYFNGDPALFTGGSDRRGRHVTLPTSASDHIGIRGIDDRRHRRGRAGTYPGACHACGWEAAGRDALAAPAPEPR